ncbi:hypothetical protein V6N13_083440 [Hibiscus sabdariffa]
MAQQILCIPLAKTKTDDMLVWRFEGKGHYTPKSGYRLLREEASMEFRDPSQFLDYRSWLSRLIISSDREKEWISAFVLAHVAELDTVAALSLSSLPSVPPRWSPPASGIIKINFDTSFLSSTKEAFSGVFARNSTGLIMVACIISHPDVNDAFVAEAKACESAVLFAIELGFKIVQLEGDSLTVIRKFSSDSLDKSIIQPIITDIKAKLQLFEKITFSHVGRQGNAAAHALARIHTQFQLPRYWVEEAPQEVEQVTLADLR